MNKDVIRKLASFGVTILEGSWGKLTVKDSVAKLKFKASPAWIEDYLAELEDIERIEIETSKAL